MRYLHFITILEVAHDTNQVYKIMKKTEITKLFNVYMNCDRFGVVHGNKYIKISEILSFEDLMRLYLVHKSLREEGFLQPVIFFEFIDFDIAFLYKKNKEELSKVVLKHAIKEMKRNWNYHNRPTGW